MLSYLIQKIYAIPVLIISLVLHEISHGFAAYLMGDKTAKSSGRLSLNPLNHIDWLGFLFLLIAGIGWAKPVPVNMMQFKDPKKGMAVTALAGPLMNILLTFISLLFYALGKVYNFNEYIMLFLYIFFYYNAVLALFNLLPIPPLDGSKVLFAFLPDKYYIKLMQYENYGMLLIFALSFFNITSNIIGNGVDNLLNTLWQLVIKLLDFTGVI